MRMISLLAVAAAVGASAPAFAQDTGSEHFDGPYIGGTVGIDWVADGPDDGIVFDTDGDGDFDDVVRTTTGDDAFSPGFCNGLAQAPVPTGCDNDDEDIGYSVRLGYDKRLGGGPIVAGALFEASRSNATDYSTGFSTTPASYTTVREVDYALALRARLGYSPGDGRGLFYVTGGGGFAKIDHDFVTTNGANAFAGQEDDKWQFGTQLGGGAEVMVTDSIALGVEYLWQRYEDDDYSVLVTQGTAGATNPFLLVSGQTNLRPSETDLDIHSLRTTLSFRF